MYLPDYEIIALCEHFPTTWSPSGGPYVGHEFPIENPGPLIEPLDYTAVGPASIDLRVGLRFASPQPLQAYVVRGPERIRPVQGTMEIDATNQVRALEAVEVVLEPSQALLCHSAEFVRIPPNLVGLLSMRSTFAREWIDHSAADLIQPGFQGTITYELKNNGPRPYSIRSDQRIMQLSLARMTGTPMKPYKGVYHGQRGEVYSRYLTVIQQEEAQSA